MTKRLWLIAETDLARLFAPNADDSSHRIWIPRSVTTRCLKFQQIPGDLRRECEIDVEDWWAEKNDL